MTVSNYVDPRDLRALYQHVGLSIYPCDNLTSSYKDPGGDYESRKRRSNVIPGTRLRHGYVNAWFGKIGCASVKAVRSAIFEINDGFRIFPNL